MTSILNDGSNQNYLFYGLDWDTEFFGVSCAKAILLQPIDRHEWDKLTTDFAIYQFVSIENRNSEPANAQLIGRETQAYLADVNVQFEKKLNKNCIKPDSIVTIRSVENNNQVLDLADFSFSKFIEDPQLKKRGGANVYREWVKNAFKNPDKYFAVTADNDIVNGFLLHSYKDNACTIELIAVTSNLANKGFGTDLVQAVGYEACKKGCEVLKVGTQARNYQAINFYHKNGFKLIGCHQTYHLWNAYN